MAKSKNGRLEQRPWFQFFAADFLASDSVAWMSNREIGIFIQLLARSWVGPGLPMDTKRLARLVGESHEDFLEMWEGGLKGCFHELEGTLRNPRLERERDQADEAVTLASRRGRLGAAIRDGHVPKGTTLEEFEAMEAKSALATPPEGSEGGLMGNTSHPSPLCTSDPDAVLGSSHLTSPHLTSECSTNTGSARARDCPGPDADRVPQPPGIGPRLADVLEAEVEPLTDRAMDLIVRLDAQTREARAASKRGMGPEMGAAAWRRAIALARSDPDAFTAAVELTEARSAANLQEPEEALGPRKGQPFEKLTAREQQARRFEAEAEKFIREYGGPDARPLLDDPQTKARMFDIGGGAA